MSTGCQVRGVVGGGEEVVAQARFGQRDEADRQRHEQPAVAQFVAHQQGGRVLVGQAVAGGEGEPVAPVALGVPAGRPAGPGGLGERGLEACHPGVLVGLGQPGVDDDVGAGAELLLGQLVARPGPHADAVEPGEHEVEGVVADQLDQRHLPAGGGQQRQVAAGGAVARAGQQAVAVEQGRAAAGGGVDRQPGAPGQEVTAAEDALVLRPVSGRGHPGTVDELVADPGEQDRRLRIGVEAHDDRTQCPFPPLSVETHAECRKYCAPSSSARLQGRYIGGQGSRASRPRGRGGFRCPEVCVPGSRSPPPRRR